MILQACGAPAIDSAGAVDMDAARAVGLDEERVEKLKSPNAFDRPADPVPNAPMGEDAGYHLDVPGGTYPAMIHLPDRLVYDATREAVPPTEKQSFDLGQAVAKLKMAALVVVGMVSNKRSKA